MRLIFNFLAIACFIKVALSAAIIPDLKGAGGGGGGGHGGGGGGRGGGGGGRSSSNSGGSGTSGSSTHVGSAYSSGSGRGGSGDTGRPSISYPSTTSRSANYFSQGGGHRFTLSESSVFKGREMGGGTRSAVVGTRGYGSGYPYYQGDIRRTGVVGQPFPFGFWPVYWGGYGHSYQYGGNRTIEDQRPGGGQVLVKLEPANPTATYWGNITMGGANQTLWMIGDTESITTILSLLYDPHDTYTYGCGVKSANMQPFNGTSVNAPVHFENVIQWYRSSSLALAYQGYNNSYALPPLNETTRTEWNESTPLPTVVETSGFVQCINNTILAALPILDPEQDTPALSGGAIAGIVIGSVAGAVLLFLAFLFFTPPGKKLLKKMKKDKKVEYTPVGANTTRTKNATVDGSEKEPSSPPPPQFPLPIHYDPIISEKTSRVPSPAPSSPPPSPRPNNNLSIPRTGRESQYSTQTLVEDVGYTHHRKSSSLHLK